MLFGNSRVLGDRAHVPMALYLRGPFIARNRQHHFRASGAHRVTSIGIHVGNRRDSLLTDRIGRAMRGQTAVTIAVQLCGFEGSRW